MPKKACFQVYDPDGKLAEKDVLDPKITGFSKEEISALSFAPHFMVIPHLEPKAIWKWGYLIYCSGSFRIKIADGTVVIISPILVSDKNILASDFSGFGNWNIEFWSYKEGEEPKKVAEIKRTKSVQVAKSGFVRFVALGTGFKTHRTRIDWKI